MKWEDISVCVACSALVPSKLLNDHMNWHQRLYDALEEIRRRIGLIN